ncbi:MAG TPA: hypothetical protein VF173_30405 [Thermoanaerobaculia bacterium]|nr:hypothetical protein [Thermoanaerobaculia bacterium]
MKKTLLGLALEVAALGLLLSPAMAAASPPQAAPVNVADQAFLSSLAEVGPPAPELAAKRPAIDQKALCTASAHCWNGTTVSCSGNNSTTSCSATDSNCSVHQRGSVTCDGVTTSCPVCPCDLNCTDERANCVDICSPCIAISSCNLTTCTSSCHCKVIGNCLQL